MPHLEIPKDYNNQCKDNKQKKTKKKMPPTMMISPSIATEEPKNNHSSLRHWLFEMPIPNTDGHFEDHSDLQIRNAAPRLLSYPYAPMTMRLLETDTT
jgi:hypothetical protein